MDDNRNNRSTSEISLPNVDWPLCGSNGGFDYIWDVNYLCDSSSY